MREFRKTVTFSLVPLFLITGYVGVNYFQIASQAHHDERQRSDVIVVFGAAEYVGKPSPVFRARLDHALDLYQQGFAPMIITTGGHGEDVRFAEGEVGRDYLISRGVPERNVIAETLSDDTAQSAERVANIMRTNDMHTSLAVSDGYHLFRIKRMMEANGIPTLVSPRPPSRSTTAFQRSLTYLREVLSISLWRLHIT